MLRLFLSTCVLLATGLAQQQPQGWVVIPVSEYSALRTKAFPAERPPESPLDAALTRVDYDLKLAGAIASGRATIIIDVLKDGWVRVPLPRDLLIREARADGNLVALTYDPMNPVGQLSAILSKKGRTTLTLDLQFPVTNSLGVEQLSLPTGGAGVTRASVTRSTPQDSEVRVTGGHLAEKSDTHWLAYARAENQPLVFRWQGHVIDQQQQKRVDLPLRMRGTLTQLFGLGEDSTSLNAEVEVEVLQGVAKQARIAVPGNVTINQVPGALVADWDVKDGMLIVNFLEPIERSAKFAITGETKLPRDGAVDIPLLKLQDSERDSGGVAVEILGAGEVTASKPQSLDAVDASDLGSMVAARQSPSLNAFRYRSGGTPSLQLNVARYKQEAVLTANVEESRVRALMSIDGKILMQARYAVRNNQRTFMRLTLPPDAIVWSASVAGRPVRPGKDPNGSLLLPLAKSRAGEEAPLFTVEVLYLARSTAWAAKGRANLALPVVDMPISRTGVTLYYPPSFRVTPETGAFHPQDYERPPDDIWNPPSPVYATDEKTRDSPAQALVNTYRTRLDTRRASSLMPVRVTFPSVGPSLYLVSELNEEGKGAVLEVSYQKDRKGGSQ